MSVLLKAMVFSTSSLKPRAFAFSFIGHYHSELVRSHKLLEPQELLTKTKVEVAH